jgi:hypothetical protein
MTVTLAPDQPSPTNIIAASAAAAAAAAAAGAAKHPGMAAVDRRVKVFWPEEGAFFTGMVTGFDAAGGVHTAGASTRPRLTSTSTEPFCACESTQC